MKRAPLPASSTTMAAGLLLAATCGCGLVDRLTASDDFSIQRFHLDPETTTPGSSVTLSWEVEGADSVEIDNGIGVVARKGSKQLHPERSATYTLTARSGTARATASVQLVVRGAGLPPSPLPSPLPEPSPSPRAPAPSPTPTPSPDGTAKEAACGRAVRAFGSCLVEVTKGAALGEGQCIELTALSFDRDCPVAFATPRRLAFEVTAGVGADRTLTWRRSRASGDVLTPATGTIGGQGTTRVEVDDLALDAALVIDVSDGDDVLLTFKVRHY